MGKNSRIKAARRDEREKIQSGKSTLDPNVPRLPPRVAPGPYKSQGPADLFENPSAKAALAAMSEEERERYRIIGEQMYGNMDYESAKNLNNLPAPMMEAVAYLETQIRSGFHPSMLEENEKMLLADAHGEEWYKKWDYVKEDLDDIVTLQPNLGNELPDLDSK